MFHKPFYITLLVIAAFIFATLKSNAGLPVKVTHKIYSTISKAPKQAGRQANSDLLLNIDDDDTDETTSKTKNKFSKIALVTSKINPTRQWASAPGIFNFCSVNSFRKRFHTASYMYKTSISICNCCLRI